MSEEAFGVQNSNGGPARQRSGVDWLVSGYNCCYRNCFFHSRLRVRYHLLLTVPLLRFDLVASVYTSSPLYRQNTLWHIVQGSVHRMLARAANDSSCGCVRASSGATGPPHALACVVFYAAAAGQHLLHASSAGSGGAAAAFAHKASDLRPASPAPRPIARWLAHLPATSAACAWAWAFLIFPLARTATFFPPRLRLCPPLDGLPSARHVGGLRIGFGSAVLVYVGRALRFVIGQ